MQVLLNIGCESNTLGKLHPVWVLSAVRLHHFKILRHATHTSDTEKTVVLEVEMTGDSADNTRAIYDLSVSLGQDCIACYTDRFDGFGALVGPKASEWGNFNPEFFLLLDGTRLAAPAVDKAA